MSEFRLDKGTKEHYTSFQDLADAWGCKSIEVAQTKDKNKLKKQRERFCNSYRCEGCGLPMVYFPYGDNIMVCKSEKCKGVRHEYIDKDAGKVISYLPSYKLLNEKSASIAKNLFYEGE